MIQVNGRWLLVPARATGQQIKDIVKGSYAHGASVRKDVDLELLSFHWDGRTRTVEDNSVPKASAFWLREVGVEF